MARQFTTASSSYITTSIGGLGATASGTIAAIVKRNADGSWHAITQLATSAVVPWWGMELGTTNRISCNANNTDVLSPTITVTAADGWVLIAVTKASGTAAPRYHKCVLSTGVWSHESQTTTYPNGTPTGSTAIVNLGRYSGTSGDYPDVTMSAVAYFSQALSDTEIETLNTALSVWSSLSPLAMWVFDQASTATPITDRTGGGANQTSISGTTVAAGDPIPDTPPAAPPAFRAGSAASGSGTTSCALTIPAAVQVGDMMLVAAGHKSFISGSTIATPAGWSVVNAALNGPTGNGLQGVVFRKVAVAGDPGSTLTISGSAAQQINTAFAAYSGVDSVRSSSWVASSTTAATAVTCPAPATAAQSNDLVVVVGGARESTSGPANTPTFTGTGTVVVRAQRANSSGSAPNVAAFIGDDPTSSTNGTRTLTATQTSYWVAGQVVLVGVAAASNVALTSGVAESLTLSDVLGRSGVTLGRDQAESVTAVDVMTAGTVRARVSGEGLTLAGAAAASVFLARGGGESLTLSSSAARNLARIVAVAEALGLADALARGSIGYARGQAESVTAADGVARTVARSRGTAEPVTVADGAARTVARARGMAEPVTVADAAARTVARARGTAEPVALADGAARTVARTGGMVESVTLVDGLSRSAGGGLGTAESVTLSDAGSYTVSRTITVDLGATTLTNAASRQVTSPRGTSDTVTRVSSASTSRLVLVRAAETLALADTISRAVNRPRTDGEQLSFDVAAVPAVAFSRGADESLAVVDTIAVGRVVLVGTSESISLADGLARAATQYGRVADEVLAIANTVGRQVSRSRGVAQTVTFADAATVMRIILVGFSQAVAFDAVASRATGGGRSWSEPVIWSNTAARVVQRDRTTGEALGWTDSTYTGRLILVGFSEALALEVVAARAATGYGRGWGEPIGLSGVAARQVDRSRVFSEALLMVADDWAAGRDVIAATMAEEISFSESVSARVARARVVGQSVGWADGAARQINRARSLPQTLTFGELFRTARSQGLSWSEGVTLDDTAAAAVARARTVLAGLVLGAQFDVGFSPTDQPPIAYPHRITMTSQPTAVRDTTGGARASVRRTA